MRIAVSCVIGDIQAKANKIHSGDLLRNAQKI